MACRRPDCVDNKTFLTKEAQCDICPDYEIQNKYDETKCEKKICGKNERVTIDGLCAACGEYKI
jgi:hypothetical protein